DESHTDIACRAMPLDYNQFQNVTIDIGYDLSVVDLWRFEQRFCYDLMQHDLDHVDLFRSVCGHDEILLSITQVHCAPRLIGLSLPRVEIIPVLGDQLSLFINLSDLELFQIIDNNEIRPISRRDRTVIFQSVISR